MLLYKQPEPLQQPKKKLAAWNRPSFHNTTHRDALHLYFMIYY